MSAVNEYVPFSSEILSVRKHTELEHTYRMAFDGAVKPGQFFEVSLPKRGEAPISVSGIGQGWVDLTIRRVGRVTGAVFEQSEGDRLFMRGPYGNGFETADYEGAELVVVAGGTGLSPVRGVVEHFAAKDPANLTLIAGFKSPTEILFREDLDKWRNEINLILTVDRMAEGESHPYSRVGLVTEYIPGLAVSDIASARAVVVGPPMMMKYAVKALLERGFAEDRIWISHERRMCCGMGKCGHCRIDNSYVCLDGPVYNYASARDLRD